MPGIVPMYYYQRTEPGLWTVGTGEGRDWHPDSDHGSREEAADRVHYLNGGPDAKLRARVAELEAKNAELEAHIQQLSGDIGHRHDAADAARQRIEDLEEQRTETIEALRKAIHESERREDDAFVLLADIQGIIIKLQPNP